MFDYNPGFKMMELLAPRLGKLSVIRAERGRRVAEREFTAGTKEEEVVVVSLTGASEYPVSISK